MDKVPIEVDMTNFRVELIKTLDQTKIQVPVLVDEVTLERTHNESASTLTFTCNKQMRSNKIDNNLAFSPGDMVRLLVDNVNVFQGRVFKKSRSSEHKIQVIAYDKIRYLLNEDTVVLGQDNDSKATYTLKELLDKITNIFNSLGFKDFMRFNISEKHADKLDKVKLEATVYENQTYLDMILDTFEKIKAKQPTWNFSLYDHRGTIIVRFLEELIINSVNWKDPDYDYSNAAESSTKLKKRFDFPDSVLIVEPNGYNNVNTSKVVEETRIDRFVAINNVENFTHEQSIDDDVCTIVKFVSDQDTPDSKVHIEKIEYNKLSQYGPLIHFENVESFDGIKEKASLLLKEKGSPKHGFSIEGCNGDISVRGGTGILVHEMNVGHDRYNGHMLVKKVTHRFKGRDHAMDLTLTTHPKNPKIERVEG